MHSVHDAYAQIGELNIFSYEVTFCYRLSI